MILSNGCLCFPFFPSCISISEHSYAHELRNEAAVELILI